MKIKSFKLTNFRNFTEVETTAGGGVNIFHGPNGSGKTNLLEAIFVLGLGRSQKGAADQVMLRHGESVYRLEGQLETDDKLLEVAVAYQKNGRKKVTIDKVNSRLSDLYELFCIVSIGPEDSEIIASGPASRRNFLDIYISQLSRRYLDNLSHYQRVLAQKNAALKNDMDTAPFDELIVSYGTEIVKQRNDFIGQVSQAAAQFYRKIAGEFELGIEYQPSYLSSNEPIDESEIAEGMWARIERSRERERIMKSALVGPHRDDMAIRIDSYPARHHGSQGEIRTTAVVLKLAVYDMLKKQRKTEPLLLLDEVFAELDESRANGLIDAFGEFGQLFLTTALTPPEQLAGSGVSFLIDDGSIIERQ